MNSSSSVDLNDVMVFATVAETGGFTAAAERLSRTKANVSLQVRRLEKSLGVELFHRTTRRVVLTEHGTRLLESGVPHLQRMLDAIDGLAQSEGDLRGTLRVSCTVDHAGQSLARHLVEFAQLHPGIQVDLRATDRVVDVVRDGIDVAMRMGWLRDSSLRAVKLGTFRQVVVASPQYLLNAGTPTTPVQLADHEWVALTLLPSPLTWKFTGPRGKVATVRMQSRLRTDNPGSVRSLVEAGAGISVIDELSAVSAVQAGSLVQLLPQWRLPEGGLYAVFPPGRHIPRHVQAFVDFYRGKF